MSRLRHAGFTVGLALALLAIVPPASVAAGGRFTDDDGSRYETAIDRVAAAGVMPGCSSTRFCPSTVVTKGKMAVYLSRALRLRATVSTHYRDVPSSLATGVSKVVAAGIMTPCSSTKFCPDTSVTRGRLASYLVKALHLPATGGHHHSDLPASHSDPGALAH